MSSAGTRYLKLDHANPHFGSDADVLLSNGAANAMSLSVQAANPYPAVLATPVYRPPIIEPPSLAPTAVVVRPDRVADIPTLPPEAVPTLPPTTSAPTSAPSASSSADPFQEEEVSAAPAKKGWSALQIAIMVLAGLFAASLLLMMLFLPRRMGTVIAPTLPGPGSRA